MKEYHREFMGHKIYVSPHCDRYADVPVRTHRKKRFRKKFLKKYGTVRRLLASDMYMMKDGSFIVSPHTLELLKKRFETELYHEVINKCGL